MKAIKSLLKTLFIAAFTCIFFPLPAFTQGVVPVDDVFSAELSSDYIQNLGGNQYRIHFTFDYALTNAACASIYRESGFNKENIVFDGQFKDFRSDGAVVAEGFYKNGMLDSTLVIRYLNGNIWQKGAYKDGKMDGVWEYYFPDGKPMYTLDIQKEKVFVKRVWSMDGEEVVKDGKGKATIYHYNSKSVIKTTDLSWRGKVRKGLMQGIWMPFKFEEPINMKQDYKDGMFIGGYDEGKFYNTVNFFSIGQDQALINAEALVISECDANPTNDTAPLYPLGEEQLRSEIYKELDKVRHDLPKLGLAKVTFHVDTEGRLSSFEAESDIGVEKTLIEVLEKLGPWIPATKAYKPVPQRTTYSMYFVNKELRENGNLNRVGEGLKEVRESLKQERMSEPKPNPVQWKKIQ